MGTGLIALSLANICFIGIWAQILALDSPRSFYFDAAPRDFIAAAKKNEPLKVFGDGRQTRCFCLVNDVVEALVRLQDCRKARGEIFNIGGTEEVSMLELARLVVKTLGSKSRIGLIPYDRAYAPGFDDMRRRKPLVEKLERFVNFKPQTPLREIIRLTAERI